MNPRRASVLVAAAAVVISPLALTQGAQASTPSCFGKKATITSSKSNKTITGTKGNDVIVVTGKNDTIKGNGGKDRICAGDVKKVTIGKAASSVQVKSGTVVGGAGNDTIVQKGATTKKSTFSGGGGINKFTVPSKELGLVTVTPGVLGDTLNGAPIHLGLPTTGPAFTLTGDDNTFDTVSAPTVVHESFRSFDGVFLNDDDGGIADEYWGNDRFYFYVTGVLAPAGSSIASWSFNPGDGSPLRTGTGRPPATLVVGYTGPGSHTATLTVTDSLGRSASRSLPVVIAQEGTVDLGSPTVPASGPVTIPVTYTAPVGATPKAWAVTFGDGSPVQSGVGAPPASLSHAYNVKGYFHVLMEVTDSNGDFESDAASVNQTNGTPDLVLDAFAYGNDPAVPLKGQAAALSQVIGQYFYLDVSDALVDASSATRYDISWGDGEVDHYTSSSYFYHEYRLVGPHAITVTAYSGTGTVVKTLQANTAPLPITIGLSVPSTIPQGPQTIAITSTGVPAGAHWEITFSDGEAPVFGTGPLPSKVTHTFNPQNYYGGAEQTVSAYVDGPDGTYGSGYAYTTVLGPYPGVSEVGFGQGYSSSYQGWTPIRAGRAGYASASLVPGQGAKLTQGTVSFGDGTPVQVVRGATGGYFDSYETSHAYATPGDRILTATATDSKKHSASDTDVVSVAGSPVLSLPATVTGTTTTPTPFPGLVGAPGANDQVLGWSVEWGDGSEPEAMQFANGTGALPGSLSHTYPHTGTFTAYIGIVTSHGLGKTSTVTVTIS